MSLRSFHILFILASLGLMAFLGGWAGLRLLGGEDGCNVVLGGASAAGLAAGVPYLLWFIRRTRLPRPAWEPK